MTRAVLPAGELYPAFANDGVYCSQKTREFVDARMWQAARISSSSHWRANAHFHDRSSNRKVPAHEPSCVDRIQFHGRKVHPSTRLARSKARKTPRQPRSSICTPDDHECRVTVPLRTKLTRAELLPRVVGKAHVFPSLQARSRARRRVRSGHVFQLLVQIRVCAPTVMLVICVQWLRLKDGATSRPENVKAKKVPSVIVPQEVLCAPAHEMALTMPISRRRKAHQRSGVRSSKLSSSRAHAANTLLQLLRVNPSHADSAERFGQAPCYFRVDLRRARKIGRIVAKLCNPNPKTTGCERDRIMVTLV